MLTPSKSALLKAEILGPLSMLGGAIKRNPGKTTLIGAALLALAAGGTVLGLHFGMGLEHFGNVFNSKVIQPIGDFMKMGDSFKVWHGTIALAGLVAALGALGGLGYAYHRRQVVRNDQDPQSYGAFLRNGTRPQRQAEEAESENVAAVEEEPEENDIEEEDQNADNNVQSLISKAKAQLTNLLQRKKEVPAWEPETEETRVARSESESTTESDSDIESQDGEPQSILD